MDDATIEKVARRYCEKLGMDPDEVIGLTIPTGGGAIEDLTQWGRQAQNVRNYLHAQAGIDLLREAIAEVTGDVD